MATQSLTGTGRATISRRGIGQRELVGLLRALRNNVYGPSGLTVGTVTTRVKCGNFTFCVNGFGLVLAAADPAGTVFTGLGLINTAAGQFCKIRVEVNSTGTITYKQGGFATSQPEARHPIRTASCATLGWIEIPASFIFGTTPFTAGMFGDGDPDLDALALEA